MNAIDTSPEACAARQARIDAAREAGIVRAASLEAAQRVYTKYRLRNDEVLKAVQNLEAAIYAPQDDWIKQRLADLCCDIEDANTPEISALPYTGKEKGELDTFTENVKCGRGA